MTQFVLFAKYVNEHLRGATSLQWARDNKFDDAFLKSSFINNIQKFVNSYIEWQKRCLIMIEHLSHLNFL